jgi:hypothetical protein
MGVSLRRPFSSLNHERPQFEFIGMRQSTNRITGPSLTDRIYSPAWLAGLAGWMDGSLEGLVQKPGLMASWW